MHKPLLLKALPALLIYLMALGSAAQAQRVSGYAFSQSNSSYREFTPDSSVGDGNNDDVSFLLPTKFPFKFNNVMYNQVQASSNGFIKMGTAPSSNGGGQAWEDVVTSSGRVLTGSINTLVASGFNLDLLALNGDQMGIDWGGAAPNRYVAVQWRNYGRYASGVNAGDDINFQIWLFETGVIEFHYGSMVTTGGVSQAQVGLRGVDTSPIEIQAVAQASGNWNQLITTDQAATYIPFGPNSLPVSGTVLSFAPLPPVANDLALQAVSTPGGRYRGCVLGTQETVSVRVLNVGASPQTTATVGYRVNGGVPKQRTVTFSPALAQNQSQTVQFAGTEGVDLSTFGQRRLTAFVRLGNDTVYRNDSLRRQLTVGAPNPSANVGVATDLAAAYSYGWRLASGNPITTDTSLNWKPANTFLSQTIGGNVDVPAAPINDWLLLTGVQTGGQLGMRFQLAVTQDLSGSNPVSSIGDDSLKVMVTNTCISGWRTVATFSQADLAAGRIDNTLRSFTVALATTDQVLSIAFLMKNNSTAIGRAYRWHLDNIEFTSSRDAQALALAGFSPQPATIATYCPGEALPIDVIVRNNGILPLDTLPIGYNFNDGRAQVTRFVLSLAPGQRDTVRVTVPQPGRFPATGVVRLRIFTLLPGEGLANRVNDTVSTQFTIGTPKALPTPVMAAFTRLTNMGWYTSRVRTGLGTDATNGFKNGFNFGFADSTAISNFVSATTLNDPLVKNDWLLSPAYTYGPNGANLTYLAAITRDLGIQAPTGGIGDDTVRLLYRTDCGPWQPLDRFAQSDLASGRIHGDSLKRFTYDLALAGGTGGTVQVAFYATNNGTLAANPWRFHVRNVQLGGTVGVRTRLADLGTRLYPNPSTGLVTVRSSAPLATVDVTDLSGRTLMSRRAAGNQTTLNLGHLPKGLYVVKLTDAEGRVQAQKLQMQ